MNKKLWSFAFALLLIVAPLSAVFIGLSAGQQEVPIPMFPDGDGSPGNPYHIVNVSDLQNMSTDLGAHYKLMNDIDASNTGVPGHWANNGGDGFAPIGDHATQFTGSFDGQNYTISNLFINIPGGNPVGMFGRLGIGSYLGNVTLEDGNVTGGPNTAILVGFNEGSIDNCCVSGMVDGSDNVGGIAGRNFDNGKVMDCFSDCIIDGFSSVGGIAGDNTLTNTLITDCIAYGQVNGANNLGGLVGNNMGPILDSSSYADVYSTEKVAGGIVGTSSGANGRIENCSSYGDVVVVSPSWETESYAGGLVGSNARPIINSTANGNVNANKSCVGGLVGKNWASTTTGVIISSYATGSVNDLGEPVAHWRMDEPAWSGAADEVADSSGNGNHGTAENGPTTVLGKFGNAGDFDGVNQRVNVPDSPSLNITKNITVSAWINTNYAGFLGTIVGKDDDGPGGRSWHLCMQNGNVRFNVWTITTGQTQLIGTIPVNTGTWRHIVASYDGNDMSIYVDGVLDVSTPKTGDIAAIVEPVQIGCMDNNWHFDGLIDDVRIYDRASQSVNVGGLVGENEGIINKSYSSGSVTGKNFVGGLVGLNTGTVNDCFWDNETSGHINSAGPETGLNTTEMMNNFTFINAGWDFTNTWFSVNGSTRPFLRMEYNTTIRNSHQLQLMVMDLTADYTLANDVEVDSANPASMWGTSTTKGSGYLPVGNTTDPFTGTLEGMGHVIDGLYINCPTMFENYTGFFGYINTQVDLMNITLDNVNITGYMYTGGLAGSNIGGDIYNCAVYGEIYSNWQMTGGIAGTNSGTVAYTIFNGMVDSPANYIGGITGRNAGGGTINNCSTYGDLSGSAWLGGIAGENSDMIRECHSDMSIGGMGYIGGLVGDHPAGEIHNSSASGSVTATTADYSGGLVGYSEAPIYSSNSTGNVGGDGYVGGLIGYNSDIVTDSWSSSAVTSTDIRAGGLVGYNDGGQISDCYATGDVDGTGYVGGLCGYYGGGGALLTTSFSTGDATGTGNLVGGLVGYQNGPAISNCYARGNASGVQAVGGLLGGLGGNVVDCYSTGTATGTTNVGGFKGERSSGTFTSCYWDNETSGTEDGVGNDAPDPTGVWGNYTLEMMQQATFVGWDFTTIWGIEELNSYPYLKAIEPVPVISVEVGITIADSADPIMAGDTFNYSFEVTNNGPDNALDVQAVINLPWTVDYVGADQTVTVVDKNITWDIGLLLDGEKAWLDVQVTENGTVGTLITCWANVTTTTPDSNPVNDTMSESTTINIAPNAGDDSYNVDEDSGPNTLDVLADDTDPDGDNITITSVTQGANGTVTIIDAGKNLTYEPDADYTGPDSFNYTIDDGNGGTDTATVNIDVENVNDPPVITTSDVTTATEDVLYSVDYNATDIDPSDTIAWDLETNADWLGIVASTGILSGTPDNDDVGSFWVNVSVSDGNGGLAWTNFTLTVSNVNDAPVITTSAAPDGAFGESYSLQINASDDDGDDLSWDLETNATWLSINSTGALSGTPTESGTHWANVSVDDGNGGIDFVNLTIVVTGSPPDSDGDGVPDDQDDFPNDATETTDTDGDGTGDNADAFPNDVAASVDTDGDGQPDDWNTGYTAADSTTGLTVDDDDDNDGIPDSEDDNPLIPDDDETEDGFPMMIIIVVIIVVVGVVGAAVFLKINAGKGGGQSPEFEEPEAEGAGPEETGQETEISE